MPGDPRDYRLDLTSGPPQPQDAAASPAPGRPYLSVFFSCCGVYLRIYRSPDGSAYRGRCPRCGLQAHFAVGEGGTDARVFVVH